MLNLYEWKMVHELDVLDREERDGVRARDAADADGKQEEKDGEKGRGYEKRKVFGVALRHISIYALTDVLLCSNPSLSSPPSTSSLPSSNASRPDGGQGHILSPPIILVSTTEELYCTGLYTPSLFRIFPSPLRLRKLLSVFNLYDLSAFFPSLYLCA